MVFLAVSTLDKLKKIPPDFWIKLGLAVVAIILVVVILRHVLKLNKFMLIAGTLIALALLSFNWVYERNEPKFMTSFIDRIAPFFPAKGAYQVNQAKTPDQTTKKH